MPLVSVAPHVLEVGSVPGSWVQLIQQSHQVLSPSTCPGSQTQRLQLPASFCSPERLLSSDTFVKGHHVQLVHHSRSHLHHAMAMPEQLPQIAIIPVRHPNRGKSFFHQQSQQQLRVLPISLLLSHSLFRISAASPRRDSNCNSPSGRADPERRLQWWSHPGERASAMKLNWVQ